jgi:hypothetical protein
MGLKRANADRNTWSKNWAGRGTAILNNIEGYNDEDGCINPHISLKKKLAALIKKYPKNAFYKSLNKSIKTGLSKKQQRCIEDDHRRECTICF